MRERRLWLLAVALVTGCGGPSLLELEARDGGPDSTSDAGGGDSGPAMSSSSGASTSGGSASASGSSGGTLGADSGSLDGTVTDGDLGDARDLEAEVPDVFPASCDGWTPLWIRADAAPNTCAFRPQDVWCDATAECVPYLVVDCGCVDGIYGVNRVNSVRCIPPPCPPPQAPGCVTSGVLAQDCNIVADSRQVAAACVDHQCMTYATGP